MAIVSPYAPRFPKHKYLLVLHHTVQAVHDLRYLAFLLQPGVYGPLAHLLRCRVFTTVNSRVPDHEQ